MARKSEAEIAAEIFESVKRSRTGQKKLKSSTFWRVFRVKSRQSGVVERTAHLLDEQGLKVSVKSGAEFGKEQSKDWIVLTLKPIPGQPPPKHPIPVEWPSPEWFATMKSREFESEREVERNEMIRRVAVEPPDPAVQPVLFSERYPEIAAQPHPCNRKTRI